MARALAAAAAVCLLVAGCGGGDGTADAVTSYIEDVNAVQRELAVPLDFVARANRDLRAGKNLQALQPKLDRSVRTISMLQRRLDALDPPPEAERLDELLRQIVREERDLAAEFAALARYAPAASAPLALATSAGARTRQELAASRRDPAAQAAALDRYASTLEAVVRTLRKLKPPQVVAADQRIQIRTYARIAGGSRSLAEALRSRRDVAVRLRALERAAVSGSTLPAQRTRAASIKAFNRRVAHVAVVAAKAQRERLRIQRRLSD